VQSHAGKTERTPVHVPLLRRRVTWLRLPWPDRVSGQGRGAGYSSTGSDR
jgi:hypothetical protein